MSRLRTVMLALSITAAAALLPAASALAAGSISGTATAAGSGAPIAGLSVCAEAKLAEREDRDPVLIRPITLHECRHTFASLLIDAGVNPKVIQEFMGHATIEETFSRYGHLMPGARDQARVLLDSYMDSALRAA